MNSEQPTESRLRNRRRSSSKRDGYYTKEVSQMYAKFYLRRSVNGNGMSTSPMNQSGHVFSPVTIKSQEKGGKEQLATVDSQTYGTCDPKSYSTLNDET